METLNTKQLLADLQAWHDERRCHYLRVAIAIPMSICVATAFVFWFILSCL